MPSLIRCACVLALLCGVAPATAQEQDLQKARALYLEGQALHQAGRFGAALEKFKAALQSANRPSIVLSIAQCYKALNDAPVALFYYRAYLDLWRKQNPGQVPQYQHEVEKHIKALVVQIEEEKKRRELELQRASAERSKKAALAKRQAEELALEAARKRLAEANAGQAARDQLRSKSTSSVSGPHDVGPTDQRETRQRKTIWAYATLGIAATCLATGAILAGVGVAKGNAAHEPYLSETDPTKTLEYRNEIEAAERLMAGSYVMFGLAAVSAAVSIYQFVTRPRVSPGAAGVPLHGLQITLAPRGGQIGWLTGF
jgi:tetratricopeptide (TPR) repeat protein